MVLVLVLVSFASSPICMRPSLTFQCTGRITLGGCQPLAAGPRLGSEVFAVSTAVVSVPEISCAACKTALEEALNPLDGVHAAVVDIAAKRVTVHFDDALIGHDALVAAIHSQGYAVAADG
jgi:copper chaperone